MGVPMHVRAHVMRAFVNSLIASLREMRHQRSYNWGFPLCGRRAHLRVCVFHVRILVHVMWLLLHVLMNAHAK